MTYSHEGNSDDKYKGHFKMVVCDVFAPQNDGYGVTVVGSFSLSFL